MSAAHFNLREVTVSLPSCESVCKLSQRRVQCSVQLKSGTKGQRKNGKGRRMREEE